VSNSVCFKLFTSCFLAVADQNDRLLIIPINDRWRGSVGSDTKTSQLSKPVDQKARLPVNPTRSLLASKPEQRHDVLRITN
jgi:hypothetical protein